MARRRRLNVFSLSFLDVMSCGFGAVVLIFLIIKHATDVGDPDSTTLVALSQIHRDVALDQQKLAALRQQMAEIESQLASIRGEQRTTNRRTEAVQRQLANQPDAAPPADPQSLRAEVERLQQQVERLRATRVSPDDDGQAVRTFSGDGDRQYLTGINVGGNRILIALDASASMLADDLVNVIRFRNLPPAEQRRAPKWQRAIRTVNWIATQIPPDSQFQILIFNTDAQWLLPDSPGRWLANLGDAKIDQTLQGIVPAGGTSLDRLFRKIETLRPRPDNIFLIIDSLPTVGNRAPRQSRITGRDRLKLFKQALERQPQAPINVILFPMEGDPLAASAYWQLAISSGGSMISPADDWP